jgi:hypothetical protein
MDLFLINSPELYPNALPSMSIPKTKPNLFKKNNSAIKPTTLNYHTAVIKSPLYSPSPPSSKPPELSNIPLSQPSPPVNPNQPLRTSVAFTDHNHHLPNIYLHSLPSPASISIQDQIIITTKTS